MAEQNLGCDHALCPVCGKKLYASAHLGSLGMLELDNIYCKSCGYVVPPDED